VYYVSFIDEFSRNTLIYFLRKKYEVFDMFKEFKALVENQIEKIIKVFRIENGGELYGNEFKELYKKCSIGRCWDNILGTSFGNCARENRTNRATLARSKEGKTVCALSHAKCEKGRLLA
jgi:hypothetical protein